MGWKRLKLSSRVTIVGNRLCYIRYSNDYPVQQLTNSWMDTGFGYAATDKQYVVQTHERVIQRCLLMTTDPGDLVLDPTCGSGTTRTSPSSGGRPLDHYRHLPRRPRARPRPHHGCPAIPYYLLADSRDGQIKEAALVRKAPSEAPTYNDIRQGFVYERVPHITLKSIANTPRSTSSGRNSKSRWSRCGRN